MEALQQGVYDFAIAIKCTKLLGSDTNLLFTLICGFQSQFVHYSIVADAEARVWSLNRHEHGQETVCLARSADPELKPNKFYDALVQCRDNVIAVTAGSRVIFQGVPVASGTLRGAVGLATKRSKLVFRTRDVAVQKTKHVHRSSGRGGAVRGSGGSMAGSRAASQHPRVPKAGGAQEVGSGGGSAFGSPRRLESDDDILVTRQSGRGEEPGRMGPGAPRPPRRAAPARPGEGRGHERAVDGGSITRVGCMSIPSKYLSAAQDAGLGGSEGMYGHLRVTRGMHVFDGESAEGEAGGHASGKYDDDEQENANHAAPFVGAERRLIDMIERDIVDRELGVTFDDIAALDTAKRLLNEAVTLPLMVPEFFVGVRQPWKGVLLFGPPGTGKTMLAKAAAGMAGTAFFNSSASTLMNKYRGESEKMVRCLFQMARHYGPSIVFIDEIDALASRRGGSSESEADRRFKAELLTQMDGIHSNYTQDGKTVMVLATTNVPWLLDEALRRRLEKRLYIPLPDEAARDAMFQLNLNGVSMSTSVLTSDLARRTPHFSGADIRLCCREAAMEPMRRILQGKTPQVCAHACCLA